MTHEEVIKKLMVLMKALNPISRNGIAVKLAIESVKFDMNTVRCKDCKYSRIVNPINHEGAEHRMCLISRIKVKDGDYCSQGVIKNEQHKG